MDNFGDVRGSYFGKEGEGKRQAQALLLFHPVPRVQSRIPSQWKLSPASIGIVKIYWNNHEVPSDLTPSAFVHNLFTGMKNYSCTQLGPSVALLSLGCG